MLNGILASGWDFPLQPHSCSQLCCGSNLLLCLPAHTLFLCFPANALFLLRHPFRLLPQTSISQRSSPSPPAPVSPQPRVCPGALTAAPAGALWSLLSAPTLFVPAPRMLQGCDRGEQAGAESVMQFCKCPRVIEAQRASVRLRCGTKTLVWGDRDLVWGERGSLTGQVTTHLGCPGQVWLRAAALD